MNIVFLVGENLKRFPLHDWVDTSIHRVFIFAAAIDQPRNHGFYTGLGYREVHLYDNFLYNGHVEQHLLALHNEIGIDRLIGIGEQDVLRAARLRQHMGLRGQSVESAWAFRDKVIMKEALSAGNVAVTPFCAIETPLDLLNFRAIHGLPVFIKPRSSCSSQGVKALRTQAEFDDVLTNGLGARTAMAEYHSDMMLEKFVDGILYHVDGVVLNGVVALIVPSRYLAPKLPMSSATLNPGETLYQDLIAITTAALTALPSPEHFSFHAEVFQNAAGTLLVNEVAARTGGGQIAATLKVLFGADITQLAVAAQIEPDKPFLFSRSTRDGNLCAGFSIISRATLVQPSLLDDLASTYPGVRAISLFGSLGEGPPQDPVAGVVVEGCTHEEVTKRLIEARNHFEDGKTRKFNEVNAAVPIRHAPEATFVHTYSDVECRSHR